MSTDGEHASFTVVLRGYDRRQVDERLRFLGAELAAAEHALRSAQERSAAAEDELARVRAQGEVREPTPRFGERVDRILQLAEEEADEVRSRAKDEGASTLHTAREEAASTLCQARDEAASMQRQAQEEAKRLVGEATAVAQQRRQEAHRDLQRLGAVREEVQGRLQETRRLLDGYLPSLQEATGGAPPSGAGRMDQPRPQRGEDT